MIRQVLNILTIAVVALATMPALGQTCEGLFDGTVAAKVRRATKPKVSSIPTDPVEKQDAFDFHRDYGFKLLTDHDPAWSDPEYLADLHKFARPELTNYAYGPAEKLKRAYEVLLSEFSPGRILHYTVTGTAANNMFYEYAQQALQRRGGSPRGAQANILFFADAYGGTHGRVSEISYGGSSNSLPTPKIHPNKILSEVELREVEVIEKAALQKIRKMAGNPKAAIGGIFIEPISINHGLFAYRPEFMMKLRELADELQLPIFADEVMSGGGRTGEFWAWQNYPGFVPDVVSFGKGLVTAGTFAPLREWGTYNFRYSPSGPPTTTAIHPLVLLQSYQVLKAIKSRNLVANARRMGAYFLKVMNQSVKSTKDSSVAERAWSLDRIRGVGLMLNPGGLYKGPRGYGGRALPPLTVTKEQIDTAMAGLHREPSDRDRGAY